MMLLENKYYTKSTQKSKMLGMIWDMRCISSIYMTNMTSHTWVAKYFHGNVK